MKIRIFLASVSTIGLLATVAGLQGQTKATTSGASGGAGVLLVDTDDSCRLVLDGKDQGVVKPDQATRISVNLGQHLLKCTVEGVPDLVWRKVVEVKNSEQIVALIALKALHIQYDEATAKLEKEKSASPATAPNVTNQDIANYYNSHKSEFNLVEPWYHLARILVTLVPVRNQNGKALNEPDARKRIQTIMKRLDSGEDFGTLAMNFSEDAETAKDGGDLGFAPESSLRNADPATRDAVTKLKPGQYSSVLQVVDPISKQLAGFQIVKLIAKEPTGQRELADPQVQQAIRAKLRGSPVAPSNAQVVGKSQGSVSSTQNGASIGAQIGAEIGARKGREIANGLSSPQTTRAGEPSRSATLNEPLEIRNLSTSDAEITDNGSVTILFTIRDPTPDVPVGWTVGCDPSFEATRVSPANAGIVNFYGMAMEAGGKANSGSQIAVTFALRRPPQQAACEVNIYKDVTANGAASQLHANRTVRMRYVHR